MCEEDGVRILLHSFLRTLAATVSVQKKDGADKGIRITDGYNKFSVKKTGLFPCTENVKILLFRRFIE